MCVFFFQESFNELPVQTKLPHLVSTLRIGGASEEVHVQHSVLTALLLGVGVGE